MAMKSNLTSIKLNPVRRPRLGYVNQERPAQAARSLTERPRSAPFQADGMNYPRPFDVFFDVTVRVPTIGAGATVTQRVFGVEDQIKQGWIRRVGYHFNTPNGYFQVQTTILINGGTPSNYIYKTVDAGTGAYQGSLPPDQIGTIDEPAETFIRLPNNAVIDVRFINNNTVQSFTGVVRLWGWYLGE